MHTLCPQYTHLFPMATPSSVSMHDILLSCQHLSVPAKCFSSASTGWQRAFPLHDVLREKLILLRVSVRRWVNAWLRLTQNAWELRGMHVHYMYYGGKTRLCMPIYIGGYAYVDSVCIRGWETALGLPLKLPLNAAVVGRKVKGLVRPPVLGKL